MSMCLIHLFTYFPEWPGNLLPLSLPPRVDVSALPAYSFGDFLCVLYSFCLLSRDFFSEGSLVSALVFTLPLSHSEFLGSSALRPTSPPSPHPSRSSGTHRDHNLDLEDSSMILEMLSVLTPPPLSQIRRGYYQP